MIYTVSKIIIYANSSNKTYMFFFIFFILKTLICKSRYICTTNYRQIHDNKCKVIIKEKIETAISMNNLLILNKYTTIKENFIYIV